MSTVSTIQVPRAMYAGMMLAATLATGAAAWLVAHQMGADATVTGQLLIILAAGCIPTFMPALLNVGRESWGMVVLGAGMGRTLLVIGMCIAMSGPEGLSRPLMFGVLTGTLTLLAAETGAAIAILSGLDRRKTLSARSTESPATSNRNPS